ncbi:MAG: primase C-terminal domain-containing protein [Bacteroides thetaiotaomicron]
MIDLTGVTHHPAMEEIVDVLCRKTENKDRSFFRVEMAYFLAKMASCMRAVIVTKDRGEIPVNMYALALATSGFGKGHSIHIVENDVMMSFKKRFMEETMPIISEDSLWDIANNRALRNQSDQQEEFDKLEAEYHRAGAYPFTFDSGTSPAVKQLRTKLLLARCGAINLQIDEIGSNLVSNTEVLNLFLELYDQGIVKQKLTKNTSESVRNEEIDGKTPTNMLLFGTPTKLLDGGPTEDQFFSFWETGYARRCLFAWGQNSERAFKSQTPAEIYHNQIQPQNSKTILKWADHFFNLADPTKFGWKMDLPDPVAIELVAYRCECEKLADAMADHEEIAKAEMSHRYFKALKLAGTYAFIDGVSSIDIDHLKQAILLVEESGASFKRLLTREKAYMKLAKYIASCKAPVTHTDLQEALPFYKSSMGARNEQITMATAWGYKQHILIKKSFIDGIEFFSGETLAKTNLDEVVVSYGNHWAYDYLSEKVPFDQLHQLTQAEGMHWCNHFLSKGHRTEENVIPGFNLITIDVDGNIGLDVCHELMKEYTFMTYTTKRHTDEENRFRLIIPSNYFLELDTDEYKEFMNNVMEWLPFKTDESANQRAKKWETFHGGSYHYNKGQLLDVLPFIPRTKKNEEYKARSAELQSLDNLERWFAQRIASGNRNNQMIKFALALVDAGQSFVEVQKNVHAFNEKLNTRLTKDEIDSTIMITVAKRYQSK